MIFNRRHWRQIVVTLTVLAFAVIPLVIAAYDISTNDSGGKAVIAGGAITTGRGSNALSISGLVEEVDLSSKTADVTVRIALLKSFATTIEIRDANGWQSVLSGPQKLSPLLSRSQFVTVRSYSGGAAASVNLSELLLASVSSDDLISGNPNAGAAVHLSLPLSSRGLYPLDHHAMQFTFYIIMPPNIRFPTEYNWFETDALGSTLGVSPSRLSFSNLPAATEWQLSKSGFMIARGSRSPVLIVYTILLTISPGCIVVVLLRRRRGTSANSWEIVAALVGILALRSVLIPEQAGVFGPTMVDILLAVEIILLLIAQRAAATTLPAPPDFDITPHHRLESEWIQKSITASENAPSTTPHEIDSKTRRGTVALRLCTIAVIALRAIRDHGKRSKRAASDPNS
jgi:hypothetical protein